MLWLVLQCWFLWAKFNATFRGNKQHERLSSETSRKCIKWNVHILPVAQHVTRKLIRQKLFVARNFSISARESERERSSLELNNTLYVADIASLEHGQQWRNEKRGKGSKLCHPAAKDSKCEKGWKIKESATSIVACCLLSSFFFIFLAIRK